MNKKQFRSIKKCVEVMRLRANVNCSRGSPRCNVSLET